MTEVPANPEQFPYRVVVQSTNLTRVMSFMVDHSSSC